MTGIDNTTLDALTGLGIRQDFEETIKKSIQQARAKDEPLSLAFLDIDNFKRLNDSLGHRAGDTIITAVANTIKTMTADHGMVYRYGGEEYTIILPATEREQAFLLIEQIRAEIARQSSLSDGESTVNVGVTISGGIAAFPIDGQDENELLRKADQALYKAKQTGRNKILLSYEEKMVPKTSYFNQTQLNRLAALAKDMGIGEAVLLREALDDLLIKYLHAFADKR